MVVDNEVHGHLKLCPNLQIICSEVGNATPCSLTIKGNVGIVLSMIFVSLGLFFNALIRNQSCKG